MNGINRKSILLVEDEAIIALGQKMQLEKYNYSVIIANSGMDAINAVNNGHAIDLILMDIDLGTGIDGPETAKEILKDRTIPIVFLSSHTDPEIVEKTEKITSYGYVVKYSGITVLDASIKMAFKLFDANKKIVDSEKKQAALISNISDVIGIVGVDGLFQYISPNIEKLFGWLPEDLVGTDGWLTVHEEDLERLQKEFQILLENEYSVKTVEYNFKCKDGRYKHIELTATNLVNDPCIEGVLINYHDISQRKMAEDKLLVNEKRWKLAQKVARIGNWEFDLETGLIWGSDEAFNIYGIELDKQANPMQTLSLELVESCIQEQTRVHQALVDLIDKNLKYDLQYNMNRLFDGKELSIYSVAEQVRDENGRLVKISGTIQDITKSRDM